MTDQPNIIIRPEQPAFIDAIAEVHRAAFERDEEAELVARLRESPDFNPKLSLMAFYEGKLMGHILFTSVSIDEVDGVSAFSLAPMGVLPDYQGQQIGSALVYEGLEACRRAKVDVVFVLGHPDYYPRFGFVPARERGFPCAYDVPDEAWMVQILNREVMDGVGGVVRFPPEFDAAL